MLPTKKNKFLSSDAGTAAHRAPRLFGSSGSSVFESSGSSGSGSSGSGSSVSNPFLSRNTESSHPNTATQVVEEAVAAPPIKAPTEEFPALGTKQQQKQQRQQQQQQQPLVYKSALLSKINVAHAEEQARIQRAIQKEVELKEERLRQLELAARRERFVHAAMNDVNGMAYDDDDELA